MVEWRLKNDNSKDATSLEDIISDIGDSSSNKLWEKIHIILRPIEMRRGIHNSGYSMVIAR